MAEYIDRERALTAIKRAELGQEYEAVESIPAADVVEVIRCRDCCYVRRIKNKDFIAWYCSMWDTVNVEDGFCNLGYLYDRWEEEDAE